MRLKIIYIRIVKFISFQEIILPDQFHEFFYEKKKKYDEEIDEDWSLKSLCHLPSIYRPDRT